MLYPSHTAPLLQHSMQSVLLNVQEGAVTLWLHWYHCFLTIQEGRCCFGNETGTLVRYTCGHYHYVCSYHFYRMTCAQCRSYAHENSIAHNTSYPESASYWLDFSSCLTANSVGQSVTVWLCDMIWILYFEFRPCTWSGGISAARLHDHVMASATFTSAWCLTK